VDRISNSRMLVEFDMFHHAMTSLFRFERDGVNNQGAQSKELQRHQITWQSAGTDADVPTERQVSLASREGQKVHIRSSSVVRFDQYALKPVSPAELSAEALGIPEGTPVQGWNRSFAQTDGVEGR